MKIRQGFVSNSSSSSFIITNVNNNEVTVYNKREKDFEVWTAQDILDWVKSMIKRECKRNNENISDASIDKWIKIDTVSNVKEKLNLSYWYAGYQIQDDENLVLYDTVDNFISDELSDKICKKFDIKYYHPHMG